MRRINLFCPLVMLILILLLPISFGAFPAWAEESPLIDWQKCLGGSNTENAYDIKQTKDKGYIVAGTTNSNDGDVIGLHGATDGWVVKLNETGEIQWQKCLGGA